jgi:hypothetical protein
MSINGPRLRTLLRQAERAKDAGKRNAAEQLYREILAEDTAIAEAWQGLAEVTFDEAEGAVAAERARALGWTPREAEPEPADEVIPAPPPRPTPPPVSSEVTLTCYRHPERETALRCYNCQQPICVTCANKTPVGYICPTCQYNLQEKFFTATTIDYIVATITAFVLSLAAGYLVVRFGVGGGFFLILLVLFVAGGIGGFIAKLTNRVIGRRRGRYIPQIVAAMVVVGVVIPALPIVLSILFGGVGALFALLIPGIYAFVAASSAFYWMR